MMCGNTNNWSPQGEPGCDCNDNNAYIRGSASRNMRGEPIVDFANQEQLQSCAQEWQERLFLQDWTIQVHLTDHDEMPSPDSWGYNHHVPISRCCRIDIKKKHEKDAGELERFCAEQTLVHELLHCKPFLCNILDHDDSVPACFMESMEHALIDQLAKSLIMANTVFRFRGSKTTSDRKDWR